MNVMNQDRAWLLIGRKVSGEATLDELRELEMLLKEDAGLMYQVSLMKEFKLVTPDIITETEIALEKHTERMHTLYPGNFSLPAEAVETPKKKLLNRSLFALAAAAILILVVGIWGLRSRKAVDNKELVSEISTRPGSRSKVTLPDGSKVWLNVGSNISYDYGKAESRQVILDGEAFFDVMKDEQRPFIIHTTKMDITVLGTTFNVRSYREDDTVETSLIQGKVEVTIKGAVPKKVILSPNQKIVLFNKEEPATKQAQAGNRTSTKEEGYRLAEISINPRDSLVAETAWTENCLVFNNERFEEIALRMERWYDIDITFHNKQVKEYRFTGTFINETVEETLEALRFTSPFHYRIDKKKIIIEK